MPSVITFADVAIITFISLSGWLGYGRGFYNSLLALMGFHFALGWSLMLMRYMAGFFSYVLELTPDMSILFGMSFLFGLFTLAWVFFSQWVHTLIKMEVVEWFNRSAGAVLGAFRGYLLVSLAALGFTLLPLNGTVSYTETYSILFNRVKCYLPRHYNYVHKLIPTVPSFEYNVRAALPATGSQDDRAYRLWQKLGGCTLTPEQLEEMYP